MSSSSSYFKQISTALVVGAGAIAAAVGLLTTVQDKLIYIPRRYNGVGYYQRLLQDNRIIQLPYEIKSNNDNNNNNNDSKLKQTAFIIDVDRQFELEGKNFVDKHFYYDKIWFLFGGNAALSLDWMDMIIDYKNNDESEARTAFCLIDYPGYGFNEGSATPELILASSQAAMMEAFKKFKGYHKNSSEGQGIKVGLMGHSLGSASVVQLFHSSVNQHFNAASITNKEGTQPYALFNLPNVDQENAFDRMPVISRVLLLSPFTSIAAMSKKLLGVQIPFINLLLRHPFDNYSKLKQTTSLLEQQTLTHPVELMIIHGEEDEIVPVEMGRELSQIPKNKNINIDFKSIKTASHNDIISRSRHIIFRFLSKL